MQKCLSVSKVTVISRVKLFIWKFIVIRNGKTFLCLPVSHDYGKLYYKHNILNKTKELVYIERISIRKSLVKALASLKKSSAPAPIFLCDSISDIQRCEPFINKNAGEKKLTFYSLT